MTPRNIPGERDHSCTGSNDENEGENMVEERSNLDFKCRVRTKRSKEEKQKIKI
jgi:hypothetical protein